MEPGPRGSVRKERRRNEERRKEKNERPHWVCQSGIRKKRKEKQPLLLTKDQTRQDKTVWVFKKKGCFSFTRTRDNLPYFIFKFQMGCSMLKMGFPLQWGPPGLGEEAEHPSPPTLPLFRVSKLGNLVAVWVEGSDILLPSPIPAYRRT